MFWLFGSAFCVRESQDADAHEAYARDIAQTSEERPWFPLRRRLEDSARVEEGVAASCDLQGAGKPTSRNAAATHHTHDGACLAGLQRCHALTCVRVRSVQRVEDVRERRAIVFKAGVLTIVKARQEDASRREARMKYLMQDSKKIDQLAPVAWQVEMALGLRA